MWFAAMMANDIIAEGDDSKLIRKFICDDGLLKSLDTEGDGKQRLEVYRLCGKTPPVEGKKVGDMVRRNTVS